MIASGTDGLAATTGVGMLESRANIGPDTTACTLYVTESPGDKVVSEYVFPGAIASK